MTLLDDARIWVEHYGPKAAPLDRFGYGYCAGCGALNRFPGEPDPDPNVEHPSGCPALVVPRIILALEAATTIATHMAAASYCNGCGRTGDLHEASSHDPTCQRWALISAILGQDEAPSPEPS